MSQLSSSISGQWPAVRDAARNYLDANNYVRVTLYPEKPVKAPAPEPGLFDSLVAAFWQAPTAWQVAR